MPLNAQGNVTFNYGFPSSGSIPIYAIFLGDSDDQGSTSSTITETVNPDATTTTLTTSANPAGLNVPITLSATVTVATAGTLSTPNGLVTFYDDTTVLGTASPDGSGVARLSASFGTLGNHALTASFAGTTYDAASASKVVNQEVVQIATNTTVYVPDVTPLGSTITIQADVSATLASAFEPTGTVSFYDGSTFLQSAPVAQGSPYNPDVLATITLNTLGLGMHEITAVYSGDAEFSGSTSPSAVQADYQLGLTVAPSPSPSIYGQPVSLSATLSGVLDDFPAFGFMSFLVDGTDVGDIQLTKGDTVTLPNVALTAGKHVIGALYNDEQYYSVGGTVDAPSVLQFVATAPTTTTLTTSTNPVTVGQPVTLTAEVASAAPTPSGSVTFYDGTRALGTSAVDSEGKATLMVKDFTTGTHPLTAVYSGDTNFASSTSTVTNESVVDSIAVSVALASSASDATETQPVTFTTTVTPSDTSFGMPQGTIRFLDGTTDLGNEPLVNGSASITTELVAGSHTITATYNPSSTFGTGTSTASAVVIRPNRTVATLASFDGSNGVPASGLAIDADGDLYGVATSGGDYGNGYVYEIAAGSNTVSPPGSFYDDTAAGITGLTVDAAGDVFGLSDTGGDGTGVLFEIPAGSNQMSVLPLDIFGDAQPIGTLAADANGNLSGVVAEGGDSGSGALFVITPEGGGFAFSNIASFDTTGGPTTGLVADAQGNLFGATNASTGTIFEIVNNGDGTFGPITPVATFDGVNQLNPVGLAIDAQGNLFGATQGDGPFGDGTLFELANNGDEAYGPVITLASFDGSNGGAPNPGLVLDAAGDLFGTTQSGGLVNDGTAFEVVAGSGRVSTLLNFGGDIPNSLGGLVGDGSGNLFGVSGLPENNGPASVFELSPTDEFSTLTLTSDVATSVFGQTVTFTATLGSADATGTVTFLDGTTVLGSASLNQGVATFSTQSLGTGTHSIVALYSGDASNAQALSPVCAQSVQQDDVSVDTEFFSSAYPVSLGAPIVLFAQVEPQAPGAGVPTGLVTLFDGKTEIGSGKLDGNAQFEISGTLLAPGPHFISAPVVCGRCRTSAAPGVSSSNELDVVPSRSTRRLR